MIREVVIDTETTGFKAGDDKIVSITLLELEDLVPTGRHLSYYVNPGRPSSEGALKVHQLTEDFLNTQPKFSVVAHGLYDFLAKSTAVGHNVSFDLGFLAAEFDAAIGVCPCITSTCTLALAREAKGQGNRGAGNKLDDLVKQFGITDLRAATGQHGSFVDVLLTAQVYYALRTGGLDRRILDAIAKFVKEELDVDLGHQSPRRTGLPTPAQADAAPVPSDIRDLSGRDRQNLQRSASVHHADEAGRAKPGSTAPGNSPGGGRSHVDRVSETLRTTLAGLK